MLTGMCLVVYLVSLAANSMCKQFSYSPIKVQRNSQLKVLSMVRISVGMLGFDCIFETIMSMQCNYSKTKLFQKCPEDSALFGRVLKCNVLTQHV